MTLSILPQRFPLQGSNLSESSIWLIDALFEYHPVSGGMLLLLVDMARYASADGDHIRVPIKQLVKDTAQTRRAVEKQLRRLFSKGFIEVTYAQIARPSEYRMCLDKIFTDQPLQERPLKKQIAFGLRMRVFERDNFTCLHCGSRKVLTVDHVIPHSKGGTDAFENLQTLCATCNCKKGRKVTRIAP